MDYKEFREVIENFEDCIEVHDDQFKIMCNFIILNDMLTFTSVDDIHLVGKNTLWFNRTFHINLNDVEDISINPVRSYLKD